MKNVMIRMGDSSRLFSVDNDMSTDNILDAFGAARNDMRTKDPSVRTLEIPNDVLASHGLFPAPVAFELALPDESVLAEMMAEDGLAFAGCAQCGHNESGLCGRYGGSATDDDMNCDHCSTEDLVQVLDAYDDGKVLEYFVLLDPDLMDDPDELLARAKKYFPSLKDVTECVFARHPSFI